MEAEALSRFVSEIKERVHLVLFITAGFIRD